MSWLGKSIRKHFFREQIESYDQCLARMRRQSAIASGDNDSTQDAESRLTELEDDLARATLLIHTLTEACLRQGVFSEQEIAAVAAEIDLFDGVADGKLDPAVVRPRGD